MSKTIEKKILPEYFDRIAAGEKTYELRLADWQCEPGDTLVLVEIDAESKKPTGRTMRRKVGFVGKTKGLDFWSDDEIAEHGYQIISLLDELPANDISGSGSQEAKSLIFSTGNDSKYTTADAVCKQYGIDLSQNSLEIDEIQGEDPEKIVTDKVNKAFDLLKKPVVVSDDTWVIPGLNGFPGSYMKSMNHWFRPQDFINLTRTLADRSIYLNAYLAYKDDKQTKLFYLKSEGMLLKEPRGKHEPASHKVISMVGDNGLSIAEVYDSGLARGERDVAKIWHDFAEWYKSYEGKASTL